MKVFAILATLALSFAACDDKRDGNSGGEDTTTPADTATGEDTRIPPTDTVEREDTPPGVDTFIPDPPNYPAPPYGKTPGTIIEDHHFLIPTDNTIVKLSDYYQHETKGVLLINASAGWCGACKQEATELNNTFAEFGPRGFDILFTLFEDWDGGAPTLEFYEGWMGQYGGDYSTVLDTNFELGVYFNVEATPMNMLVDLGTMEIVWLETGFNPFALAEKLDELLP